MLSPFSSTSLCLLALSETEANDVDDVRGVVVVVVVIAVVEEEEGYEEDICRRTRCDNSNGNKVQSE